MKINEFKGRLIKKFNELVDVYYGEDTIVDRLTNSTIKVFMAVNNDKIDEMLSIFSPNGEDIDADAIINAYVGNIPEEGFLVDIKKYIKNPFINGILPNKSLSITKEDIKDILNNG